VPLRDVVITTAGSLTAQYIFHSVTIGPDARSVSAETVITQATRRCLELLDVLHLNSIAFPAIGAGGTARRGKGCIHLLLERAL
jgi:O-acetyl-ADP-ribose deacetylase (regulator of RNase III)